MTQKCEITAFLSRKCLNTAFLLRKMRKYGIFVAKICKNALNDTFQWYPVVIDSSKCFAALLGLGIGQIFGLVTQWPQLHSPIYFIVLFSWIDLVLQDCQKTIKSCTKKNPCICLSETAWVFFQHWHFHWERAAVRGGLFPEWIPEWFNRSGVCVRESDGCMWVCLSNIHSHLFFHFARQRLY